MLWNRNSWRDWYNPLRGLSIARLVALEDAAERGQPADLQWLYHHMERADVTVQAALARRLSFTDSLDWEIRAVEAADPALAADQAALLRHAYDRVANLREATRFLAAGIFRGFAHLEKLTSARDGLVYRLEPVEQWYWMRPGRSGPWRLNPESRSHEAKGEPVERERLCVFEAPAVNRAISRHFFAKTLAFADWDLALETSANQSIFIVGPPGTSPEKEQEYREVAEKIASNGRGYLPNGTDVKLVDTQGRARLPYFERIKYCDEQIVLAATGGLLTMLTQSGSGTLAGGAHSEGLLALARSDAARLSEVFQRDLDRPLLREFFPGQPTAAYFEFDVPQQENPAALIESVGNLSWAGYTVDQKQLEEKTGLKLIPLPKEQPA